MTADTDRFPDWIRRRLAGEPPAAEPTEGSGATTAAGPVDQSPVVAWEALNLLEAEVVKQRLGAAGIPALIRGEALGHLIGLTSGGLARADVLVPAPLAERAIELLAAEALFDEFDLPEGDLPEGDDAVE